MLKRHVLSCGFLWILMGSYGFLWILRFLPPRLSKSSEEGSLFRKQSSKDAPCNRVWIGTSQWQSATKTLFFYSNIENLENAHGWARCFSAPAFPGTTPRSLPPSEELYLNRGHYSSHPNTSASMTMFKCNWELLLRHILQTLR